MKPISVGIAGLGRSGWGIHAAAAADLPELLNVVAAMDFDANRRQDAADKFDCATYDNFSALVADPEIELVVVATPNRFHAAHVLEALAAGKHVLCEKPFGTHSREAGEMIAAAKAADRLVMPFQNRRYEPLFQKVKEIKESGILGEITQIRTVWGGFSRRWDWQTLTEFEGGQLLNNAPHAVDQAMQLFGEREYELMAEVRNVLTSGDAEDQFKAVLRPTGAETGRRGPLLDIEMNSSCAFPQDVWSIYGDSGSLRAGGRKVEWKWVDWNQLTPHPVDRTPTANRSYNSESLPWQTDSWEVPAESPSLSNIFYTGLYETLRNGKPLLVTPQSVQAVMRLIEEIKEQSPVQQGRFSLAAQAK
jgi:predicted dehydrogenase